MKQTLKQRLALSRNRLIADQLTAVRRRDKASGIRRLKFAIAALIARYSLRVVDGVRRVA